MSDWPDDVSGPIKWADEYEVLTKSESVNFFQRGRRDIGQSRAADRVN